eukprot:scaffold8108_cov267-Pinguiococcus_pyrenoidosus.AAC.5
MSYGKSFARWRIRTGRKATRSTNAREGGAAATVVGCTRTLRYDLLAPEERRLRTGIDGITGNSCRRRWKVINTYRFCERCLNTIQPLEGLQQAQAEKPGLEALATEQKSPEQLVDWRQNAVIVRAASYGHPSQASLATNCTQKLQGLVSDGGERMQAVSRAVPGNSLATTGLAGLRISSDTDLRALFGDPCPGQAKVLRIRYAASSHKVTDGLGNSRCLSRYQTRGVMCEASVYEHPERDGYLREPLHIKIPQKRALIRVENAQYGHPRGAFRGRFAVNVSEVLSNRVQQVEGQFLRITTSEDVSRIFGDPQPGRMKVGRQRGHARQNGVPNVLCP